MDRDLLELEARKTVHRHERAQDRLMDTQGPEATDAAIGITQAYIGRLSAGITAKLEASTTRSSNHTNGFEILLRQLDNPELVALVILQSTLRTIGMHRGLTAVVKTMAMNLEGELWVAKLTQDAPKLAAGVESRIRRRYSRVERRKKAFRAEMVRHGYKQKDWADELRVRAGGWMVEVLLASLPDVFVVVERDSVNYLAMTPQAQAQAVEIAEDMAQRMPVFLPSAEEPLPWSGWATGGPRDQREAYARTLLRSRHKDRMAQTKSAIKTGQAQPALDALNALQGTPWRINTRILDVIQACVAKGIEVPGLPGENIPAPMCPAEESEHALWKLKRDRVRNHNTALVGDRIMLAEDLQTAERMRNWPAFWTPMSLDWRGRVYGMTTFNFQRDDRVRALFLFAEGEPIGEDGLWWLKVHLANCGAFEKIDKRPLAERVAWVDENLGMVHMIAQSPLLFTSQCFWTKADKPFLFLAACGELSAAIAHGPSYVTRLPVSFDGSCSGLQHLCAMTRAPEGSLVNLTSAAEPQDVYATVARQVLERVTADLHVEPEEGKEWVPVVAKLALAYGIDRKLVKRNVMTYAYSSKKYGMSQQQQTDLMDVLEEEVLTGKLEEHPFGPYAENVAAKYLAGHVFEAIEEVINLPAQAMAFLQKLARALAHEGKPLSWTTPTGLPWINRYHVMVPHRIRLWMADRGVTSLSIQTERPSIDKEKSAGGVAPNFVHALDAAHLMLVANAAAKEGMRIATVHDSFGCLAPHARRFNAIIREQFVEMYETHDVLAEVLAQAKHDLTPSNWHRLPDVPQRGGLELEGVKNAEYAFA